MKKDTVNNTKRILDACCGSKMMWFDKHNPDTVYVDKRTVEHQMIWRPKEGKAGSPRYLTIAPDIEADFTSLPFPDNTFYHVVFDPPHLVRLGESSWLAAKYGRLDENWPKLLHDGFAECMRVLKPNGTLIFKWSEIDIPLKEVLSAIGYEPLYGHKAGKHLTTHWLAFIKDAPTIIEAEEGEEA